jgi:hypothetical protein
VEKSIGNKSSKNIAVFEAVYTILGLIVPKSIVPVLDAHFDFSFFSRKDNNRSKKIN